MTLDPIPLSLIHPNIPQYHAKDFYDSPSATPREDEDKPVASVVSQMETKEAAAASVAVPKNLSSEEDLEDLYAGRLIDVRLTIEESQLSAARQQQLQEKLQNVSTQKKTVQDRLTALKAIEEMVDRENPYYLPQF